jgi:signal peptidase
MSGDDPSADDSDGDGALAPLRRFWTVEEGPLVFVRDILSSAAMVLLVAGILFGVSGVWPPMVAVKSGSMNPHMHKGDLVFVTAEERFAGQAAVEGTGVVTNRAGKQAGYQKFGAAGDVIVYRPDNDTRKDPIIHRAMFYVQKGENWYGKANDNHVRANSCRELVNCPAPNEGFITKGDNPESNAYYDQARGMTRPVKPSWVEAKAMVRIPALGWIRLEWSKLRAGAAPGGLALALGAGLTLGRRRAS